MSTPKTKHLEKDKGKHHSAAAPATETPRSSGPSVEEEPQSFRDTHGVLTSTMNDIPGYRVVKVLGTVYGLTVRTRNWGADIGTFFKSAVGGELKYFTNMMYTSRNSAVERMIGECLGRGGNAVIALRFDAGDVGPYAQVCAYGTACVVERVEEC